MWLRVRTAPDMMSGVITGSGLVTKGLGTDAGLYGLEDLDVQSAGVLYLDVLQQLARAVELRHLCARASASQTKVQIYWS